MATTVLERLELNKIHHSCFSETMMNVLGESKCILELGRYDFLFHKGNSVKYIYYIQSGFIQLFRAGSDNREHSLIVLGEGEWIGYRDALSGGYHQHDARSLRKTKIYRFDQSYLLNAMQENLSFSYMLMQEMIRGWAESEEKIYALNGRRIYEKLAEYLLKLEKRRDKKSSEDLNRIELTLPITRQVLASLLGTTKESIIRALSDFKNRGWIDIEKNKIFLLNKEPLIRLLESS